MNDGGEPLDIVAHGGVIKHLEPQRSQPLGDELRVGIDDLPHQQLCANGDDFCDHDCVTSLYSQRNAENRVFRIKLIPID